MMNKPVGPGSNGRRRSRITGNFICDRTATKDAPRNGHDGYPDPGGSRAQLTRRFARPAARGLDLLHRGVGVGQEQPGVRHDLRRRAAAVCGEPVELCPPVPRADAQAGSRQDRWVEPVDLDPAEDRRAEPPLHRRHDHRDQRLPPRPVRPGRPGALPELRPDRRRADARPDHRAGGQPAHRRVFDPGPGDPRPEGGIQGPVRRAEPGGLHPGAGRWQGLHAHHPAQARPPDQAPYRGRRRPVHDPARPQRQHQDPPGRGGGVRAQAGRGDGDRRRRGQARPPPLVELRLRPLRAQLRPARARNSSRSTARRGCARAATASASATPSTPT